MSILHSWAAALGGVVSGGSVLCPGPGHSPGDRSLTVTPARCYGGSSFVCHSFAGDDFQICRDYVRARIGEAPAIQIAHRVPERRRLQSNSLRTQAALKLWDSAVEPRGTLVDRYLAGRGLVIPPEAANEAIRFHPDCPFGSDRFPAMVCLVRNAITDQPQGIQRTALKADGTAVKAFGTTYRKSLGRLTGGAVKLDPEETVTDALCIGEGTESSLAGKQLGYRPVWAVLSTSGIETFPVIPRIMTLKLFEEIDANGASARAVLACGARWSAPGRVRIRVTPDAGNDLNDQLMAGVK